MKFATNQPGLKLRIAVASLLAGNILGVCVAHAATTSDPAGENVTQIMETLRHYPDRGTAEPARQEAAPRLVAASDGNLSHMVAPPGHAFQPRDIVAGKPEETARKFLNSNRALFGMSSERVSLAPYRTHTSESHTFVRLQQSYEGVPVFAGQVAVQMNEEQGVEFVGADVSSGVNMLDGLPQWTAPTVLAADAITIIANHVVAAGGVQFTNTTPVLMIFEPSVVGETGPIQLVWESKVACPDRPELNERWLIDAKSGEVARRYALTHSALNRMVSDANTSTALPGLPARFEGNSATGITDVDNAYVFLGDAYNFFLNRYGRDSYDDDGAALVTTVRYCASSTNCPWANAQAGGSSMQFGNGYAVDDVVAHEFAHLVTTDTSDLVYANASGAINEMLSDIFGEFVDLTNGAGNDSATNRWNMGEDLPNGRLRSMSNPPMTGDPDRRWSANYIAATNSPTSANDNGGVHTNSGVGNKLCYLLTDGDTFNGQAVFGLGINRVADLFYLANVSFLTSGSGWSDLYEALRQASWYLGWNLDEQSNLHKACLAVEIAAPDTLYVNAAEACFFKTGEQFCNVTLGSTLGGPFETVNQGVSGAWVGDRLMIRAGSYNETVIINKYMTLRAYAGDVHIGE